VNPLFEIVALLTWAVAPIHSAAIPQQHNGDSHLSNLVYIYSEIWNTATQCDHATLTLLTGECGITAKEYDIILRKNGVFWDVTPCGSCKNRHFGGN
jgi:hypothetical protein